MKRGQLQQKEAAASAGWIIVICDGCISVIASRSIVAWSIKRAGDPRIEDGQRRSKRQCWLAITSVIGTSGRRRQRRSWPSMGPRPTIHRGVTKAFIHCLRGCGNRGLGLARPANNLRHEVRRGLRQRIRNRQANGPCEYFNESALRFAICRLAPARQSC